MNTNPHSYIFSFHQYFWNSDFFIDDNTLSVNVARLRKKLEAVGLKDFIETKKGVGYGLRHDG